MAIFQYTVSISFFCSFSPCIQSPSSHWRKDNCIFSASSTSSLLESTEALYLTWNLPPIFKTIIQNLFKDLYEHQLPRSNALYSPRHLWYLHSTKRLSPERKVAISSVENDPATLTLNLHSPLVNQFCAQKWMGLVVNSTHVRFSVTGIEQWYLRVTVLKK